MTSPFHYFRESLAELRRVTWPSQKTVVAHTILVVIISVVLMIILSAFDFGLGSAYSWIIRTLAL